MTRIKFVVKAPTSTMITHAYRVPKAAITVRAWVTACHAQPTMNQSRAPTSDSASLSVSTACTGKHTTATTGTF